MYAGLVLTGDAYIVRVRRLDQRILQDRVSNTSRYGLRITIEVGLVDYCTRVQLYKSTTEHVSAERKENMKCPKKLPHQVCVSKITHARAPKYVTCEPQSCKKFIFFARCNVVKTENSLNCRKQLVQNVACLPRLHYLCLNSTTSVVFYTPSRLSRRVYEQL